MFAFLGNKNVGKLLGFSVLQLNEDEKKSVYLMLLWRLNGLVNKEVLEQHLANLGAP